MWWDSYDGSWYITGYTVTGYERVHWGPAYQVYSTAQRWVRGGKKSDAPGSAFERWDTDRRHRAQARAERRVDVRQRGQHYARGNVA